MCEGRAISTYRLSASAGGISGKVGDWQSRRCPLQGSCAGCARRSANPLTHRAHRRLPLRAVRLFLEMTCRHPGTVQELRIADDGRDDEPVHAVGILEKIEILDH